MSCGRGGTCGSPIGNDGPGRAEAARVSQLDLRAVTHPDN